MRDLIFDLDGTLVDSLPGIEACVAAALAEVAPGLAPRPLRPLIGPPLRAVLALAYPELPPDVLDRATAAFRARYDADGWRLSTPYPGAAAALTALRAAGWRLFVATQKPDAPTGRILAATGLLPHFVDRVSPDSEVPGFASKAAAIGSLVARHRIDRRTAIVVGDAEGDREAAVAHGMGFVAATYGYGGVAAGSDGALMALADLPALLGAAGAPVLAPG